MLAVLRKELSINVLSPHTSYPIDHTLQAAIITIGRRCRGSQHDCAVHCYPKNCCSDIKAALSQVSQ